MQTNELVVIVAILLGIFLLTTFSNNESLTNLDAVSDRKLTVPSVLKKQVVEPVSYPIVNEMELKPQDQVLKDVVDGKPQLTTDDLLPKYDEENEFAKQNPVSNLLKEQNFLISGYHVGVNTVMQSNKIPYHDLRSAPPIPKENISPFLQSSYETPMGHGRKSLEVGM